MASFHKDDNSVACNVFKMIMLFFYSVSRLCLDRYVNKTEVLMLKTCVGRPFSQRNQSGIRIMALVSRKSCQFPFLISVVSVNYRLINLYAVLTCLFVHSCNCYMQSSLA